MHSSQNEKESVYNRIELLKMANNSEASGSAGKKKETKVGKEFLIYVKIHIFARYACRLHQCCKTHAYFY